MHDFEQNVSIHLLQHEAHSFDLVLGRRARVVHKSKPPCGPELSEFDPDDALGFLHRHSIGLSHPAETRKCFGRLSRSTDAVPA